MIDHPAWRYKSVPMRLCGDADRKYAFPPTLRSASRGSHGSSGSMVPRTRPPRRRRYARRVCRRFAQDRRRVCLTLVRLNIAVELDRDHHYLFTICGAGRLGVKLSLDGTIAPFEEKGPCRVGEDHSPCSSSRSSLAPCLRGLPRMTCRVLRQADRR